MPTSDYHVLLDAGRKVFEVADQLNATEAEPAKTMASCLGIVLLAVKHGYLGECKESLIAFAQRYQLHPDGF